MKTLLLTILLLSFGQAQAAGSIGSMLLENCEAEIEVQRVGAGDSSWTNVAKGNGCLHFM